MITLITGVPGAGKTSLAVSKLLKSPKEKVTLGCPVKGVRELSSVEQLMALENTIALVDEAQKYLPSGKVEFAAWLSVHRHQNMDVILVTQSPTLLNRAVLPLVGKHFHVGMTPLGERKLSEWDRAANPRSRRDLEDAKTSLTKVDRSAWSMYDTVEGGAEIPKLVKSSKPRKLIVAVIAALLLCISVAFFGNFEMLKKFSGETTPPPEIPLTGEVTVNFDEEKKLTLPPHPDPVVEKEPPIELKSESPIIPNPSPIPEVVGCVRDSTGCRCYTSEAQVSEFSQEICAKRYGA